MPNFDLTSVPGVAECDLGAATVAGLPSAAPPAPWDCHLDAVVWWTRGGRAAARAAGRALPGRYRAAAVIGGMVSYRETPVGAYHEVYGAVGFRRGRGIRATVPFMSVDSPESLVGGRSNWSLPKCPGEFTGEPGGTMNARGGGWQVRITTRTVGLPIRLPVTGRLVQPWPDGTLREAVLTGRARARAAVVTVEVESDGELARWLRPGRHLGAVLTDTTLTLSTAR